MIELKGLVRSFQRVWGVTPRPLRLSDNESLIVAQMEDVKTEATRAGARFMGGNQIIGNGIAPVTAIPTTTATLALYNAAEAGQQSLIIDRLGFWLGSGTPTAGATLFATVSTSQVVSAPTANATGYGSQSCSGSSNTLTKAIWTTGVTLPSMSNRAPAWIQVSSTFQLAAANVGQGDSYAELHGAIVVPPKHCLGLAILSGTGTTPLYGISATWSELAINLE